MSVRNGSYVMIQSLYRKLRRRRCPHCNALSSTVIKRRMNTAYAKDEANWITCCMLCFVDAQLHWKDMWESYYSEIM